MTAHKNFKRFLKRLRRFRFKKIPKNLFKPVSNIFLNKKIVDTSDISKIQIKIIHSLIKKLEKILDFAQRVMDFFCSGFIVHLPKRKNGRYRLYLEAKNKPEHNANQALLELQDIHAETEMVLNILEKENNNDKNKPLIFSMLHEENEGEVNTLRFAHPMKEHNIQKLSGAELLVKHNVLYRWEDNFQKWSDVEWAKHSVPTISPSSHLQIGYKQT